ncbi:MAG: tRNA(Ile)-lysidine synthase [Gammaproteobacteria bacterium]|nr:tRNA(Ile)-lysidine synthase [Gammaproteobacteria bacterium]
MRPPPPSKFGPDWLAAQLAALVPGFPDVTLCVALSGGVDSTALLAALAASRRKLAGLRAVHVDHGLHPASSRWSAHCRALARSLNVPLKVLATKVERTRGVSLEAAAREARYQLLASSLAEGEVLLTGHHSDDQLETVLLQLFRGSGLPGIAAMPALASFANGWLARPLLARSRAELEAWVRERGLTWVEDETNTDERLDRNYLRRRVLPLIRERWPGAATAVSRSARHAAEAQALLDMVALTDVERASYGESLSVKTLRALAPGRRRNALRFWIARSGRLLPDTRRLEEIAGPLMQARADANPFVEWEAAGGGVRGSCDDRTPRFVRIQRHADVLSIREAEFSFSARASRSHAHQSSTGPDARATRAVPPAEILWSWRASGTCELPDALGKLELVPDRRGPIDLDALPEVLTVRWRLGGERLSPRRGGPRRALKSLLQEAHVPMTERARVPMLFSGAKLVAVADLLLDETVQATPATRHRGRVFWKKSPH